MKNDYRDIMNEFPLSLYDTDDQTISKGLTWIKGPAIRFGELSNHTQFIYQNKILMKIDQYNAQSVGKRNIAYYLFNQKDLVNMIDWKNNQSETELMEDLEKSRDIEKICFDIKKQSVINHSFYTFKMFFNDDQTQSHCYYVKEENLHNWTFHLPSIQVNGVILDILKLEQNDLEIILYLNNTILCRRPSVNFKSGDCLTIDLSNVKIYQN